MSEIFEIAYAAATKRLCFFTGTGFSKAVTNNEAPSWQGLLEELCKLLPNPDEIIDSLFPEDKPIPLSLEEAAQVIAIKLAEQGKNIHEEIADLIEAIDLGKDNEEIIKFFSGQQFRVVTTNYDKLAEALTQENTCQSLTPAYQFLNLQQM